MSAEEYKAMVYRVYEAINNRNLDILDELHSQNFVSYANPPRLDKVGLEQSKKFLADILSSFPDLHTSIEEILVEGDAIAYRWVLKATHTGFSPSLPIPPTGKEVTLIGCSLLHVKDGKFVDEWEYWDQTALLEQLGVLPPT
jgi:steroid delta-isomerase-like uncharacterized protein